MNTQEKLVISIAGAGNAGTFLASRLYEAGCSIRQVYSRTPDHARSLAEKVDAIPVNEINLIDPDIDLLIIALPDRVIPVFCKELSNLNGAADLRVASASGPVQLNEISPYFSKSGVLYPLQSFTLKSNPDAKTIPFCIEGTDIQTEALLDEVASMISNDVRHVDSYQRLILHLSAVFACNFTNHMIALADEIIAKAGLDFSILLPLINETIGRLKDHNAAEMQTGPAIRNDNETIQKHLDLLKSQNTDRTVIELYSLITASIRLKAER